MRHAASFVLAVRFSALLLAACASPVAPPDGAPGDAHFTADSPPDTLTYDGPAPPPDSPPPPPDSAPPPPPPDAGAMSCEVPASGGAPLDAYCDQVQIAVLAQNDGTPARVQVRGRMTFGTDRCARIDSVELRRGDTVLQTVDAAGAVYRESDMLSPWIDAPAAAPLAALCGDEHARFEVVGVYVRGRRPGGTFTARCALRGGEGRYPPMTTLSCHRGLPAPPLLTYAMAQSFAVGGMSGLATELSTYLPRTAAVAARTVQDGVYLIPAPPLPFSPGAPLMPRNTTGWTGAAIDTTIPVTMTAATQLSLRAVMSDPLGVDYCPPPDMSMMPPLRPLPVFLARVDGTTTAGAFRTEIYVSMCTRVAR